MGGFHFSRVFFDDDTQKKEKKRKKKRRRRRRRQKKKRERTRMKSDAQKNTPSSKREKKKNLKNDMDCFVEKGGGEEVRIVLAVSFDVLSRLYTRRVLASRVFSLSS